MMRNIVLICIAFTVLSSCSTDQAHDSYNHRISTEGNSWLIGDPLESKEVFTDNGLGNWIHKDQVIRTYFHVDSKAEIQLGIQAESGYNSTIQVRFGKIQKDISFKQNHSGEIYLGKWDIPNKGYYYIEFQGIDRQGKHFPNIRNLLISADTNINIRYIKDDYYFARRGPSVHLNFPFDENIKAEYFYSEIEIPKYQDVIGSYFMANGFKKGYFGIQVNSDTERRILFSVWSPYQTDDPNEIPKDQRIQLLKKGISTYTGKFGNEGSGGQSYQVFPWKAGVRYGFLLKAEPYKNHSTDFTAWFFDPEKSKWDLIASFRRPKTNMHLTRLYSFLENFIPETGVIERHGGFYNQWIRDTKGEWHELTNIYFTADNTARKENRLDYSGGVLNEGFYMKNCGFSNERTEIGTEFQRPASNTPPIIDFEALNQIPYKK